jgi:hypothetical protein
MKMKEHLLAALREECESWEELLASLSAGQITTPRFDFDWSIKDVIAHLWAWQQISIARLEGGLHDQEPAFPQWIVESIEYWEDDADGVNALTFRTHHNKPWSEIYQNWKNGFLRFLELGEKFPERDLLDRGRYPWLNGHSLAFILIASYDHHQEHLEKLTNGLRQHGN